MKVTPVVVRRAVTAAVVVGFERETFLSIVVDVDATVVVVVRVDLVVVVFILSVPTPDIWIAGIRLKKRFISKIHLHLSVHSEDKVYVFREYKK